MKKSLRIFFLLSIVLAAVSCGKDRAATGSVQADAMRQRFDSCIAFLDKHRIDMPRQCDTMIRVCEEIKNTPSELLTEKQRRSQLLSYQTYATIYMVKNKQDSMLLMLTDGMNRAEKIKDSTVASAYYNTLIAMYSAWDMKQQTRYYIGKSMATQQHLDDKRRLHTNLIVAGAYLQWQQVDTALVFIDRADSIVAASEEMRAKLPVVEEWTCLYMKGWVYSSIPDSAEAALRVLTPIYTKMAPVKYTLTGYEVVCYNLARAHETLGNTARAQELYDESLDLILKARDVTNCDAAKWLMNRYIARGDKERQLKLLPVWNELQQKVYSLTNQSILTAYNVQFRVEEQNRMLERSEWKLSRQRLKNYVLICIIVILLITCAWGIWFWQVRKRKMRKLFEAIMFRYNEWHNIMLEVRNGEAPLISVNAIGPNILLGPSEKNAIETMTEEPSLVADSSNTETIGGQAENNDKSFNKCHALYCKVLTIMEKEKPFINPRLTIDGLVRIVGTNRTDLSSCINRMSHCNFSYWIAIYRVNYLLECYMQDKSKPLEAFIGEAGFSSRSSFYRQFKMVTGLTPTQFKNFSDK